MIFNKRKKAIKLLKESFGRIKNDYFNFEFIGLFFNHSESAKSLQKLSDKTCNDLDFDELFMFVDRTSSKIGQQYLYNKLRTIPLDQENTKRNEEIISILDTDTNLRTDAQFVLSKLKKDDVYYISSLFQEAYLKPPKWFNIIPLLSVITFGIVIMLPFYPKLIVVFTMIFIVNMIIHYWNKKNLFQYIGSISELINLNNIARSLFNSGVFKTINPNLEKAIKSINKEKIKLSVFRLENKIQGDFEIIFWALLEIIKGVFLLEPLLLFRVLNSLDRKRNEIESIYNFVGEIDSLISITSLREGLRVSCIPSINENSNHIFANDIYHPLIENCIPNNLSVGDKSVLLTGSNMSGKTSFIRAIGINIITGLTLNTCFASSINISRTRIYSAIRISDDLMNNKSYYFEEVLRIKEMILKSHDGLPSLFLLDEIFKGTNTVERISAGKAVLSNIASKNNLVFVSTHDIELTDLLIDEYELFHFSEIVDNKTIDFDYKLKDGKLKNRNAIRILEINNYPIEIITEANRIAENFDKNKSS